MQTRVAGAVGSAGEDRWGEILNAQRRLDPGPLRGLVRDVLLAVSMRPDADPDPLRSWRELSAAITTGHLDPLDATVRGHLKNRLHAQKAPSGTWDERATVCLDILLEKLPAESHADHDLLAAMVLSFCYLECIVFWEYSTEYDRMQAVLDEVARRAASAASKAEGRSPSDDDASALLCAVASASSSLCVQFTAERALLCGCPWTLTFRAGRAVDSLTDAGESLEKPSADARSGEPDHEVLRGMRQGLRTIVGESISDALLYFGLIHDHIGPAAKRFVGNLQRRHDNVSTIARLQLARDAVNKVADDEGGDAADGDRSSHDRIRGVFQSEARAQGRALDAMLDVLAGGDSPSAAPTLIVDDGEIHFLYPFSLDTDDAMEDTLAQELREAFSATREPLRLAGCEVTIEDALQSEVFTLAASAFDRNITTATGVRIGFSKDDLVLDTTVGTRYLGLDIEVVLGPFHNYVVRIGLTTQTPMFQCAKSDDDRHAHYPECDRRRVAQLWTPHELDLFMHRGAIGFDDDRIYFVPKVGATDDVVRSTQGWSRFTELAAEIICDLQAAVTRLEPNESAPQARRKPEAPGDPIQWSRERRARELQRRRRELRQQAHVLVVLSESFAVSRDVRTRITNPAQLAACRGAAPVLSSQPPIPRVLEEWTCAPPPRPSLLEGTDGLVGSMDSQIVCNGDSTLMFVPSSPHWQVIQDRELVMFAVSLGSVYARANDLLLASAEDAARDGTSGEEFGGHSRKDLADKAARVSDVKHDLTVRIKFADSLLSRARGAALIRPRRDRQLLEHVTERSGVNRVQQEMAATRTVAEARQHDLRDAAARVAEEQRMYGQTWVERLLLVVAVTAFIDLFALFFDINGTRRNWGWTIYFFTMFTILAIAAAGIAWQVIPNSRLRPDQKLSSRTGNVSTSEMGRTDTGSDTSTRASSADNTGSPLDSSTPSTSL